MSYTKSKHRPKFPSKVIKKFRRKKPKHFSAATFSPRLREENSSTNFFFCSPSHCFFHLFHCCFENQDIVVTNVLYYGNKFSGFLFSSFLLVDVAAAVKAESFSSASYYFSIFSLPTPRADGSVAICFQFLSAAIISR